MAGTRRPLGSRVIQQPLVNEPAARFSSVDEAVIDAPLATRMRPRSLKDFVGQEHLLGPGKVLRRAIESDQVTSMILWGPPGSGKTSLAQVIAAHTKAHFIAVTGVSAGVADLRKAAEEARRRQSAGERTILFIDEIHRFNKAQQDAALPFVESGLILLIGATTENPSFEVNSALLSRSRVYRMEALTDDEVGRLVDRALSDQERGLGTVGVVLDDDARASLIALSGGDARVALNALELAVALAEPSATGQRQISQEQVEEAVQRRALLYDRAGDQHYDVISAFIKSIRGSDPDAAVYWLARMLEAGEDPLFVARRLVILASEDVGLADPMALSVAVAAQQAAHFIGMPEGFYPLSEATLYLACAPKSNSVGTAYHRAADEVQTTGDLPVPLHLRNAVTGLMRGMGYGKGYRYAHSFEGHVAEQRHLPEGVNTEQFFEPSDQGAEAALRDRLERLRALVHGDGQF
ncbi:MAG: replication-associated recombination protein A [Chloroflexi bacterium]|nr:replication-associated recombination protein A [Chloroflexota bacterium]